MCVWFIQYVGYYQQNFVYIFVDLAFGVIRYFISHEYDTYVNSNRIPIDILPIIEQPFKRTFNRGIINNSRPMWSVPGGRLNKKDGLTRYGDSHVKDKTS